MQCKYMGMNCCLHLFTNQFTIFKSSNIAHVFVVSGKAANYYCIAKCSLNMYSCEWYVE